MDQSERPAGTLATLWGRIFTLLERSTGSGAITDNASDDLAKLIKLVAVAAVIVPPFAAYYIAIGLVDVGIALALTGVAMGASLAVYRATCQLPLARDFFLACLFCYLCYATHRFGTLVSPTGFWFAAIPVISVLLSGGRAGFAWLAVVLAGIIALSALADTRWAVHGPLHWSEGLYVASLSSMVIATFLFVLMIDIARRKTFAQLRQANEAIQELARRDSLTGLYNRRYAWEALQAEEDRAKAETSSFSILLIDLDHFKNVNDLYGHVTGDIVLKDVSNLIEQVVSGADFCGRYGGEEFLVLLRSKGALEAKTIAEKVRRRVAAMDFDHVEGPDRITVSVGAAEYQTGETFAETFKRADQALYAAKAAGRNCVILAEADRRTTRAA